MSPRDGCAMRWRQQKRPVDWAVFWAAFRRSRRLKRGCRRPETRERRPRDPQALASPLSVPLFFWPPESCVGAAYCVAAALFRMAPLGSLSLCCFCAAYFFCVTASLMSADSFSFSVCGCATYWGCAPSPLLLGLRPKPPCVCRQLCVLRTASSFLYVLRTAITRGCTPRTPILCEAVTSIRNVESYRRLRRVTSTPQITLRGYMKPGVLGLRGRKGCRGPGAPGGWGYY